MMDYLPEEYTEQLVRSLKRLDEVFLEIEQLLDEMRAEGEFID